MKILCPRHKEDTPSCEIYENNAYCFGCQQTIPLEECGVKPGDVPPPKPKENLEETMKYIDSLPTKKIRGFWLPFDEEGYYIVWPERNYYKKRFFDPDKKSRYKNPTGHKQPLFETPYYTWAGAGMLVEGELNALSVFEALRNSEICPRIMSPGGAGQFNEDFVLQNLETLNNLSRIDILVDQDGAGAKAAIELKAALLKHCARCSIYVKFMPSDANDLLALYGSQGLKEYLESGSIL